MTKKNILYISGSIGLGHITRDLAIARELRRHDPTLDISWLAANPANTFLRDAGEKLVEEADQYANENIQAEKAAGATRLNLISYLIKARKDWQHNGEIFKQVTQRSHYDLIIGDETYEVELALRKEPRVKKWPFVIIFDFLGLESVTRNPLEKLGTYYYNRTWSRDYRSPNAADLTLFVGEPEDIPDRTFGFLLPNRREYARDRLFRFIGYIFQFDPAIYADRNSVRERLGYGKEPLIICSIGGTAIGKELLELCGEAYPILKTEMPDLHMVLVCGPRLSPASLRIPGGIDIRGYVPDLYEHLAASDLAIVLGGGTTTLELTALRRPFIYFPLEGQCEQEVSVAGRIARHQAGVKMHFSKTTPESLAKKIKENIGQEVAYPPIPIDGAEKAAHLIVQLLK
jgi:predicted glycosyltransferase